MYSIYNVLPYPSVKLRNPTTLFSLILLTFLLAPLPICSSRSRQEVNAHSSSEQTGQDVGSAKPTVPQHLWQPPCLLSLRADSLSQFGISMRRVLAKRFPVSSFSRTPAFCQPCGDAELGGAELLCLGLTSSGQFVGKSGCEAGRAQARGLGELRSPLPCNLSNVEPLFSNISFAFRCHTAQNSFAFCGRWGGC